MSQRVRKETRLHWYTDQQEVTIGICWTLCITYSCWATLALSVESFLTPVTFIPRHHIPEDKDLQFSSSRRYYSFDSFFVISNKQLQQRENMVRGHGGVISHNDNMERPIVYYFKPAHLDFRFFKFHLYTKSSRWFVVSRVESRPNRAIRRPTISGRKVKFCV